MPEDISAALEGQWDNVPRRSLEAIAVEGYRTAALTEAQVRRLLELDTRFQVHALLKEHHVPLRYSEADLEDDLSTHRELGILLGTDGPFHNVIKIRPPMPFSDADADLLVETMDGILAKDPAWC